MCQQYVQHLASKNYTACLLYLMAGIEGSLRQVLQTERQNRKDERQNQQYQSAHKHERGRQV